MFQTEIIHYIQSFETAVMTQFMQALTALGYRNFIVLFLVVLIFGVDFRKGFIIMQGMLWTALVTTFFKDYFALPRPYHVDSTVRLLDGGLPSARELHFERMGAKGFFALIPESVVNYYRNLSEPIPYGFPSGHTSMAVTLWGITAYLFRSAWLRLFCVLLIILVPFSRMYLGVHFLGDVLGGYVIGFLMFWLTYRLILKPRPLQNYLIQSSLPFRNYPFTWVVLLISPLVFLMLVPMDLWNNLGLLWGMNLSFFILSHTGLPYSQGKFWTRLLRVLIATSLFVGITALLSRILPSEPVWRFLGGIISGLFFIGVSTAVCLRLGFFSLEKPTT